MLTGTDCDETKKQNSIISTGEGHMSLLKEICCWMFCVTTGTDDDETNNDLYSKECMTAMVGHSFPDVIKHWDHKNFQHVGYGLSTTTALATVGSVIIDCRSCLSSAAILGIPTARYWHVGLMDIQQMSHAIL